MNNDKIVGYVPRILYRVYIYLKDKFDPKNPIKIEEDYCVKICSKLIQIEDSKLYYSPLSHKRFIRNENKDMFVVLENRTINLINHVYSYSVYIESDELYNKVINDFDVELDKRRLKLEEEIKNNIRYSLKTILDDLMT